MRQRKPILAALLIGITGAFALAADAPAQNAGVTEAPIEVSADAADISLAERVAHLSGHVVAKQGAMTLSANRVTVFYAKGAATTEGLQGQIERLEAEGNVRVIRPGEEVRSSRAVYRMAEKAIVMSGGVTAVRGENVVRGDRLVINLAANTIKLDAAGKDGRVKGLFIPEKKPATP